MKKRSFSRLVALIFSLPLFAPADNTSLEGCSSSEAAQQSSDNSGALVAESTNSLRQLPVEVLDVIFQYLVTDSNQAEQGFDLPHDRGLKLRLVCENWRDAHDSLHIYKFLKAKWQFPPLAREFVSFMNHNPLDKEACMCGWKPKLSVKKGFSGGKKCKAIFFYNYLPDDLYAPIERGVIIDSCEPQTLGDFLETIDGLEIGGKKPFINERMIVIPKETFKDYDKWRYLLIACGSVVIIVVFSFINKHLSGSSRIFDTCGALVGIAIFFESVRGVFDLLPPKKRYTLR